MSSKKKMLHLLNVCGYLIMIIMNYLAISLPLGGLTTKELSDQLYNLFTPAGITFSIWGVIYLLLGVYVFYALFSANSAVHQNPYIDRVALPFFISTLLNSLWIIAWHYQKVLLSMVIMAALLFTLIFIYTIVPITYKKKIGLKEILVFIPFSVYLGWISVATVANAAALFISYGVSGGRYAGFIASVMIVIASVLALISISKNRDVFYSAVIAWAFYGIYLARNFDATKSDFGAKLVSSISIIMSLAIFVLVIASAIGLILQKWSREQH